MNISPKQIHHYRIPYRKRETKSERASSNPSTPFIWIFGGTLASVIYAVNAFGYIIRGAFARGLWSVWSFLAPERHFFTPQSSMLARLAAFEVIYSASRVRRRAYIRKQNRETINCVACCWNKCVHSFTSTRPRHRRVRRAWFVAFAPIYTYRSMYGIRSTQNIRNHFHPET